MPVEQITLRASLDALVRAYLPCPLEGDARSGSLDARGGAMVGMSWSIFIAIYGN